MGQHHTRVYDSLPNADLVGVFDTDEEQANKIASQYGVQAFSLSELLSRVDAVSIAVPTRFHYDIASQCLHAGCDVLIEKPIVRDISEGVNLIQLAERQDAVLQVGHIERFNPAVQALDDIVPDLDVIAFNAKRLGPPLDRHVEDSAVLDLMIHDIDIILSLVEEYPNSVASAGALENRHAIATMTFESGVIAELTASRLTQKKIRTLDIIARECLVQVDYIDRSIEIHRASTPKYIQEDENIRYQHESIVERPMVESTEPLRNELSAFIDAVKNRSTPIVTGEDALNAVRIANQLDRRDGMDIRKPGSAIKGEVSLD
jgi:predicted dehydrogenase